MCKHHEEPESRTCRGELEQPARGVAPLAVLCFEVPHWVAPYAIDPPASRVFIFFPQNWFMGGSLSCSMSMARDQGHP